MSSGLYGECSQEVYDELKASLIEKITGFANVDHAVITAFRRDVDGIARVIQFGCVELRQIQANGGNALEVSTEIVGEMSDLERAKLYLSVTKAGGKGLAKNSTGPVLTKTQTEGLKTDGAASDASLTKGIVGST